jgi:tetratricopeptide (TPR) repeat protein
MNKALEIFPDFKDALLQMGNYCKQVNRTEEAKTYFGRYLKIEPNDKKVSEIFKALTDTLKTK